MIMQYMKSISEIVIGRVNTLVVLWLLCG